MTIPEITAGYVSRKELARLLGESFQGKPYSEFTIIAWEKNRQGAAADADRSERGLSP
jgi:hypothetical protein